MGNNSNMSPELQTALLHQKVDDMSESLKDVMQTLRPAVEKLTQHLERHDALADRVARIETAITARREETDPVIRWAYKAMGAVAIIGLIGVGAFSSIFTSVSDHESRIAVLEHRK